MNRVDEVLKSYRENFWGAGHETLLALADEYAKLRDETPITEEWIAMLKSAWKREFQHVAIRWSVYHEKWSVMVFSGDFIDLSAWFTTRGQVRCLLLAAGIECDV